MQAIKDKEQIDAFLAYREGETQVSEINTWLKQHGVRTHYFHDKFNLGDPIDEVSSLNEALCMVVFLGDSGWGETQLKLVATFQASGRPVFPVLIGNPPEEELLRLNGLFRRLLYLDIRTNHESKLEKLLQAILMVDETSTSNQHSDRESSQTSSSSDEDRPTSARLEHLLHIFKDGSDRDRLEALRQINGLRGNDRSILAYTLRKHLRDDFSADTEKNFAMAVREPKRLASIRSWMLSALIQLDAERNSDLIIQHLQESYEPDRNVRFWTLAGLHGKKVSFRGDAIKYAELDSESEIRVLAQLMRKSPTSTLIKSLESQLHSEDFKTVWQVLRALRIVPVPQLAPVLSDILFTTASGTALAYDVLYAFTPSSMAKAAAPILLAKWTSARVTREIVETTAGSAYQSGEHFVNLLSLLVSAETIGALKQCLSEPRLRYSAEQLLQQLRRLNDEAASRARHRPGFHSDKPGDITDRLGIAVEARNFAAIMTAKDVSPPLAIGLFGDWGSGKSFFMGEMRRQAETFSNQARVDSSSPFCAHVAHIEFNAWHYADSNLWASLVSCMLEKLHGQVNGIKTPAEDRAEIELQIRQAVQKQHNALLKADQAAEELRRKSELLATAVAERHQRPVSITELSAGDWKRLIEKDPGTKKAIAAIAERLGMGNLMAAATDWQVALSELRSQTEVSVSLARTVTSESRKPLWLALFVAVLVIPVITVPLYQWVTTEREWLIKIGAITAQITTVLAGAATWLHKALVSFSDRRKDLEEARDWVNQLVQAKRDEVPDVEKKLEIEVTKAAAVKEDADQTLAAALAEIARLEAKREEFSLGRFLSDRHKSDDYRKQLGIFTTIRRDFEVLVDRLTPIQGQATQLDRIVLYIDDLDRCPTDKVVEVLQAVHLLLAYPLFVVVVGVDSRWLLHSLSSHFKQFDDHVAGSNLGNEDDRSARWSATPQHYLEKIFQIPYVIRPMTDMGFGQMMDALLKSADNGESLPLNAHPQATEMSLLPSGTKNTKFLSGPEGELSREISLSAQSRSPVPAEPIVDFKDGLVPKPQETKALHETSATILDEAALTIQPWETEYAKRLHAFIPSPRAAKRFSNVYRILKAAVPANELTRFEGSTNFPGEFRVAMILLAQQISSPYSSTRWFDFLAEQSPESNLSDALRNPLIERFGATHSFKNTLEVLRTDNAPDLSIERVKHWLSVVNRFSFDLTRHRH